MSDPNAEEGKGDQAQQEGENADAKQEQEPAKEEQPKPAPEEEESSSDDDSIDNPLLKNAMMMMDVDNYWPGNDDEKARSLDQFAKEPVLQRCCCCICNCETKATEGVTCCCIIPIKCGLYIIVVGTIILAAIYISAQFFLCLNDYVQWWYCAVNLVFLLLTYIAASFFIIWLGRDNVQNRGRLACGCTMVIVSHSLLLLWNMIYFLALYEGDTVYYGWGTTEKGYVKYSKKYYLFREMAYTIIVIGLYSYFTCVCNRYSRFLKIDRNKKELKAHAKRLELEKRAEKALDEGLNKKPVDKKEKKESKKQKDDKEGGDPEPEMNY